MEVGMSLLSSATVFRLLDSMAIVLAQGFQLARARPASAASPILRLRARFGAPVHGGPHELSATIKTPALTGANPGHATGQIPNM